MISKENEMHIDLSSIDLPDIYVRQNKKCYLDPIRKKLIFITPEETVRQQVVFAYKKVMTRGVSRV